MLIGVTAARQVTRRPCRLRDEQKNQSKQSKQNFKICLRAYVCMYVYACACVRACRVWYTYTAPEPQHQRRRRRCRRCMLAENEKEEIKSKEAKNRLCQLHSARLLSLSLLLCRSLNHVAAAACVAALWRMRSSNTKTCFVEFRVDYFTLLAATSMATAALRLLLALCQLTLMLLWLLLLFWRRLQKTSWCRILLLLLCVCVCVCALRGTVGPATCTVRCDVTWRCCCCDCCCWWMKTLRWLLLRIHTHTHARAHTVAAYIRARRAKF